MPQAPVSPHDVDELPEGPRGRRAIGGDQAGAVAIEQLTGRLRVGNRAQLSSLWGDIHFFQYNENKP